MQSMRCSQLGWRSSLTWVSERNTPRTKKSLRRVNTTPLEVVSAGRGSRGNQVSPGAGGVVGAPDEYQGPSAAWRPLLSRAHGLGSRTRLFEQQEAVGQQDHRRVVVEPAPAPTLEVVQTQLLLHLLVTLLHTPPALPRPHRPNPRGPLRQVQIGRAHV